MDSTNASWLVNQSVGKEHLPGVIGAKPVHLTTMEERKSPLSLDALRIDIGSSNGNKIKVGDRATFATTFSETGPSIRAKALDNRLGVASLIEIVRNAPANIDLLAAFTVQEEVGLRGAQVAAYAMAPDMAIVLDCTPANDLPSWDGSENDHYNSRIGSGPAIYIADRATISDPRLASATHVSTSPHASPRRQVLPHSGRVEPGPRGRITSRLFARWLGLLRECVEGRACGR